MIAIFTGGRDFAGESAERKVSEILSGLETGAHVYVGDCPTGLDEIVRRLRPDARVFRADWEKLGIMAGPARNNAMLRAALWDKATLFAFPGGKGTRDCARKALSLEIPVREIE